MSCRHESLRPSRKRCACLWLSAVLTALVTPVVFAAEPQGRKALVIVKGVTTPFSALGLIKHFNQIPEVKTVSFDLSQGLADVILQPGATVSDEELRRTIRNASYTPGPIHWKPAADTAHGD